MTKTIKPQNDYDLIVVGAGMVGMSTALWAQKEGLKTLLCDANPPGSGTTYGSACTIATYACIPVNNPSIFTSLPYLLTSKDSPLSFNIGHGIKNPRWMLSFLNNCRKSRVKHIIQAIGPLLSHTDAGLDPLITEANAQDLVIENDCLYVWSTMKGYDKDIESNQMRLSQGVNFDVLSQDDVRRLEPNIQQDFYKGLLYKGARHIDSPQELVTRMLKRFEDLGGTYLPNNVISSKPDKDGVTIHLDNDIEIRSDRLALTAGARSGQIKGTGAEQLPLGTERGYHILYKNHKSLLSRPVGWAEAGFYSTPMADGLRIAGTVEINAIDAKFNHNCTDYLQRKSHQMFGDLGTPDDTWLGHRPTMPDSLPVIGHAKNSDRIIYAFGHHHIGLTLGGITGKIVTDLAQDKTPTIDISKFAPTRFS